MNNEATLSQHLSELRKRLTWSAIVLMVVSVICFVFHQQILSMLMGPASGFPGMPNEKPIYFAVSLLPMDNFLNRNHVKSVSKFTTKTNSDFVK